MNLKENNFQVRQNPVRDSSSVEIESAQFPRMPLGMRTKINNKTI